MAASGARSPYSHCTSSSPPSPGRSHKRPPAGRLGYIQTAGGTHPARATRAAYACCVSADCWRATSPSARHSNGEREVITTVGSLHQGLTALGWDAAVCGPGPGVVGSAAPLGHVSLSALDSAHAALALGCQALLVAVMSSADRRQPHRGISSQTLMVLDLLLAPVTVALPAGVRSPVGAELRAGLGAMFGGASRQRPAPELQLERPVRITRHDWRRAAIDLPGFAASTLPLQTPDGDLLLEPLFFAAALAAGVVLAQLVPSADDRALPSPLRDQPEAGAQRGKAKLGA